MFWSDLGSAIGFEAIGLIDSTLPTMSIFAKRKEFKDETVNSSTEASSEQEKTEGKNEMAQADKNNSSLQKSPNLDNYEKGVIFYMQGKKIVGILLWNVFNRISLARKILASDEIFDDLNEVAKLFDIFDQHYQDNKESDDNDGKKK
jgi:programmed cell death 8 (apoptosis-inducing factor)